MNSGSRDQEKLTRRRLGLIVALVVVAAAASRVPFVFAEHVLGFDDGVYLSSVHSMRLGYVPYREIFSSQGPLFLPTLRLFDVLGGEAYWAPRVTMAVAAVALVAGSVSLVIKRGSAATWIVGSVVALSGSVFLGTSAVEAEGLAFAFGIAAFGVVTLGAKTSWRPLLAGLLLGVALSIKSLFLVPVALSVAWIIWRKHGLADLLRAGIAGLLVVVASFFLWGVAEVWDQSVVLHFQVSAGRDPLLNAKLLVARAWKFDKAALMIAVAIGLAWLWSRSRVDSSDPSINGKKVVDREVFVGLAIWTTLTLIVLLLQSPIFNRHSLFLLVPAILLIASIIHIPKWVALIAVAGAIVQVVTLANVFDPEEAEQAAIRAVRELPPLSLIVSDEPGIPYLAGYGVPPNLVDPSFGRIGRGYLTIDDVESAVYADETCGVLFWSGRFDRLGLTPTQIEGYDTVTSFGPGRVLLERTTCRSP